MRIIITGVAGFIGFHLAKARLAQGDTVIGIDNLNDYYDVRLKKARLRRLMGYADFIFYEKDMTEPQSIHAIFSNYLPQQVIHLAAQAGVRYAIEHPEKYIHSNLLGFANVLEACRKQGVEHLIYASTSSVYGANETQPSKEADATNHPLSLYAATKKSNELMAHAYSHIYYLPTTGLRFFTVYGPWGRPDMAFFKFTRDIFEGTPLEVYNHGEMARDFTYIDDIIQGISNVIAHPAKPNAQWNAHHPDAASSKAPYRIYNIGRGEPVALMDYIHAIEKAAGKKAILHFMPMQDSDVRSTHADTSLLAEHTGYQPRTDYRQGIEQFVLWYRSFYQVGQEIGA